MKILLTIAWRNIWRHPGRSGALLAAIIIGLWAGVVTVGLMNAMLQQRMDYMIDSEITHAQIHHPDFRDEGSAWMYIEQHAEITQWLKENPKVTSFTSRTITDGMLQSPVKTSGVSIRGIDVETEPKTTTFHENLVEGEYLDTDMNFPVLLGKSLAEEHNMEIGNRIVLTFERTDNELTSAAFNIAGFYKSASSQYDNMVVFVRNEDLSDLLQDEPLYHEIAMMLTDVEYATEIAEQINATFSDVEAKTWSQISPELGTLAALGGLMLFIVTIVIMIALAFGIL
ncbi:MAG: ABC transporter permease, partial [Chitinophagaceae bacterium]